MKSSPGGGNRALRSKLVWTRPAIALCLWAVTVGLHFACWCCRVRDMQVRSIALSISRHCTLENHYVTMCEIRATNVRVKKKTAFNLTCNYAELPVLKTKILVRNLLQAKETVEYVWALVDALSSVWIRPLKVSSNDEDLSQRKNEDLSGERSWPKPDLHCFHLISSVLFFALHTLNFLFSFPENMKLSSTFAQPCPNDETSIPGAQFCHFIFH